MRITRPLVALTILCVATACVSRNSRGGLAAVLQNVAFETRQEISVGSPGVADAVLADLDGDGVVDLAATTLADKLVILLGQGNGAFAPGQTLDIPGYAFNVRAADIDGDLDIDLVVLRSVAERVSVFLNDGNASFTQVSELVVPEAGDSIVLGDCTGDGVVDIVVSHLVSPNLTTFSSNGDGTFTQIADFVLPAGSRPAGLVIGDLNADGLPDLAVADTANDRVFVFRTKAAGGHEITHTIAVGDFPLGLAIGDLTLDGVVDIAVSCLASAEIFVLNGAQAFTSTQKIDVVGEPGLMDIADVTGDGLADLVLCVFNKAHVSYFAGTASGMLAAELRMPASGLPFRPLVGDVNGDGRLDLLATSSVREVISLYLGRGDGLVGGFSHDPGVSFPKLVAAADMNGDGRAEVAVAGIRTTEVAIMGMPAGATDIRSIEPLFIADVGLPVIGVVSGDFDGDGRLDFAVDTTKGVKFLANASQGGSIAFTPVPASPTEVVFPASGPFEVGAADMDGDGDLDLVITDTSAETVAILRALGPGFNFETNPTVVPMPGKPVGLVIADLTDDGNLDVAVTRYTASMITVLAGDGDGQIAPHLDIPVGAGPTYMRGSDFDRDGSTDLIVSNAFTDEITLLLARQGGFSLFTQSVGRVPTALQIGDLNRDTADDILVTSFREADIRVVLGTGDGGFGAQLRFPGSFESTSAALADLDGDGLPDLTVATANADRIDVYRNVSQ